MLPAPDLRHSQQDQAAILAHELRQPLQSMAAALAVIRAVPDRTRQLRALEIADRQVAQVTHVVEQLQALAQSSRRAAVQTLEPVDLRELLKGCVEAVAIARPRHALTCRLPAGAVWIRGHAGRLRQVCSNLLDNAVKFTGAGGRIHASLDRTSHSAVLRVADTGAGIPAAALDRIFDLFAQAGGNRGGGAGIGLAVARAIVAEHGGRIAARSDGPGTGSTFTVMLPLTRPGGAHRPAGGGSQTVVRRRALRR